MVAKLGAYRMPHISTRKLPCPNRTVSKKFISRHGLHTMSIPGLGQDEPEEDIVRSQVNQVKVFELSKEQEWRFEVAIGKSIEVTVGLHAA